MNTHTDNSGDPIMVAAIVGGIFIAMLIAWHVFRGPIATGVFSLSEKTIPLYESVYESLTDLGAAPRYVSLVFPTDMYKEIKQNRYLIRTTKPKSVAFGQVSHLLLYPAYLIRPFLILFVPWMIWFVYKRTRPSRKATRENIYSLAKRMAPLFPQIRVAIYDKKHKGGNDTGPYRREESPIRFAIQNELLIVHSRNWEGSLLEETKIVRFGKENMETDEYVYVIDHLERGISQIHERCNFNEAKAIELFISQLGEKWRSIESLPVTHQLLFCAIALYAKGEKDRSYSLFWEINRKWNPGKKNKHLDFKRKFVRELVHEIKNVPEVNDAILNHAYIATVFQGLLCRARKRGRIPSNLFYWLKKEDRTLWYSLNQEGGQCGWTESGAARAHILAERAVKKVVGETAEAALHIPVIGECVKALYATLYSEGWIADIYPEKLA